MKKNYFKFHIKVSSIVEVSKTYYLLLIFLSCILFSSNANAQVAITEPNLSITSCSGFPSAYSTLGNIIITESAITNFSTGTGITLVLSAPANFEFRPVFGTVAVAGSANLSSPSIAVTASTITITYTCSNNNKPDTMTISGLQVRAINSASTGNITRTGGTGVINGLVNGTTLASLTSINTTPTITTQPTATSVCTNGTTTFNVVATGAATYQWRKNGVNLTNTAPYSGVNTGTLTITNPNISENLASFDVIISSSTPCSITSTAAILTVNPVLPASISIAASANPICDGTSVTFTATPTNGGTTPSYQWKLNGTNVGLNATTYTNAALANGDIITCELTSNASPCLTGSPATSNAVTMIVNPNLPASISISESVNTICDGTSVTFTATPVNGGTSPAYQWKLNGTNVGSNAATYTNTTLANGDVVTCVLTSNATCATGSPALSNEVTMIVNPILPASISILESVNNICNGTSVTFTATPTNGGTTPAYQWKLNGTNVGSNATTYTNAALANGDIVTCVLTSNATPCLTGNPATSNAITMTVNPNLPASVNIGASANPICIGTSVTFTATPTNGGTSPSYQWKLNGTNVGSNATTYTNAALANGDIVTCELTSNATPCLTGNPATSNAIAMTVNPLPVSAGIITGTSSVCQGEASVSYSVPAITNATSYAWSYSGTGATITGTTDTISITFATNATSGNLSVYGVNACGNGIISANYPIIVNPLPIAAGTITGTSSVCQSQASVSYTVPAITNASSYFWTYSGTGATISGTTNTVTITFAGNATSGNLTVYGVNSCGNGIVSSNYAIVVNSLPVITSEPVAATVCTNGTTTFSVSATGTTTYQWRKNGINLTNAAPYSGVNTATLTITNPAKTENSATFDVVLNGATCPVTSESASLTVYEKVVISSQPIASQIFCEGNTATITVAATGDGLTYQWYKGATALADGGSISGVNSATLTITPLVLADGATYHCVVSGTSPCNPVVSNNSILNVNQGPIIITPPAVTQTICEGNSVSFSVGATVGSLSYQWYKGAVALGNGGNISGVNTATLTINPVSISDADSDYNCIVNNGCFTETKSSELIVNPKPNAVATNASQTICSGSTITTMVLSGNVAGTIFNWTRNNTGTVTGIADNGSGDISGSLTNTTNVPVTITFTITPIANNCPGTPITAAILVNPTAQVNQPTPQVVCNTGLTSAVTFATANSGGTTSYSWTNNTASIGLAASGNGNIPAFTAINTGTTPIVATIIVTPTFNNGSVDCSGSTKTFTITVNPTAQVNQPTPQVVCNAGLTSAVTFGTANSGGTTSYTWTNNTASIGLAASGNGNIPAFTAINNGTTPIVATIIVTPTFNNGSVDCSGSTKTFTITVNPTAQVNQPTPQVVCNAGLTSAVTFATANSGGTTSYSWTNNIASIGLAASGNGNISAFTAINNGTTPIVATIVVTPTFNNGSVDCSGSTKTFTITVNPTAQVNQPTPQVVCNAGLTSAVTFATANSGGTTSYSWTNNTASIGLAASGNGNIPAFTAINTGTTPVVATIVVTPTFNNGSVNCSGSTKTFTITVNPTAQVNQPTPQVVCNAGLTSAVTFATANSGGTTSYSWTNNTASIGLAASGNGNIPAFTAINTGTTPVVATIVVTPTFNNGSVNCSGSTKTFTITVNPTPNAIPTPATQTICSTNALTIGLSGNVAGTTFNWTRDNTGTVTGIAASGSGNIVGSLTNTTNVAITVTFTITPTANGCPGTPINATVLVEAASVGGAVTISQPNVLPVEKTTTVCHKATGTLYLSGYTGTIIRWESSTTGGASWVPIANTNPTYQYPEILATTIYRAVIQNGPNCVAVFSTSSMINVIPNIKPSPVTATPATICAGESSVLFSQSGYATSQYIEPGGDFGNSNPANWTVDSSCKTCLSAGASNTFPGPFQLSATNGGTYSGVNYTSNNKFAIANGNYNSTLETPLFNTLGLTNASLQFNHSYNLLAGAYATVELSVDGGNSYNIVLAQYNGPSTQQPYNLSTVINLDLNQYLGLSNLRVRFNYHGTVGSSWAIDNILIPDVPVNLTTEWVDASTNLVISTSATVTVTPTVTTTYAVTSRLNGCTSFGPEGTTYVTVTVNQKPVVTAADTIICSGETSNVPLSSSETGTTFAWTVVQTNVSGAIAGNGNAIAQTLTATGTAPGTAVYTITPTAKGCVGPTKTVTVTVNPKPTVSLTTATVCSGEPIIVPTTFSTLGTTFTWTVVQTNVTGASAGAGATIAHTLTAINGLSGTAVYTVTPTANGCVGTPQTVTINVNPKPTAVMGPIQTICYGGTATFSIALTGTPPWNLTYTDGTTPTTVTTSTNPYIFSVTNVTADKTYTLTSMGDAQCSASPTDITGSATVTVLNGIPGLWTGLVSTDWFDCLNWAGGLPSSTVNAVIGSLSLRMPVIDPANSPFAAAYGNIASAQDLIIATGASVTMTALSTSDLHISRNWINRGSFVPGIGTVTFNGATLDQVQTINAGIKTNETFYNLVTNNSNGAKGISVVNAFELTVSNTLSLLSGDLRLTGEAQLIQNGINPNPSSGSGKLLIDQQGQKSSFNYNYWSSPVSTNGTNYSISGVLRDGTDVTTTPFAPLQITFGDGGYFADGALTSPIKISNRWLHSYNSPTPDSNTEWDDYYLWKRIGSTGVLKIGEGYIMKGTTGIIDFTSTQNYVFVGKPNSGTIPLFLPLEQTYLIGNPYPSALDADEFIRDNLKDCSGCRGTSNVFNGALYFWDQFGGGSHYLSSYVGGYAAYSLMSSVVAVADNSLGINDGSMGTKIPGRYIPVAQGFLIDAATDPDMVGTVTTIDGGTLNFKNSQRAFIRESSGNSVFMKTNTSSKKENSQEDTRPKIRLNLTATSGTNRQILVGADSNTTNFFDIGYDAPMLEMEGNKIYWEINSGKFVIQAIPNFDIDQQIPLGLSLAKEEEITIKISSLENIPGTTEIYLYDNVTGMYHDIKNSDFKTTLSTGEYRNRFSLRFTGKTLSVNENNTNDGIIVLYSNNYKVLIIQNNIPDTTIEDVGLYNLLGQAISNWDIENEEQTRIQIPIKNVSSGVYVVKLKTSNGDFSKKIIIK